METSKSEIFIKVKIINLLLICLIFLGPILTVKAQLKYVPSSFATGADQPELYLPLLKGKRVGVVTNQTGLLKDKTHLLDYLIQNSVDVKKVFAPEHGFRGVADAGEHVKNGVDQKTGIPIVSLYASNKKPSAQQLQDLDVILFDIQDVGVRFYTYISTLTYIIEAAADHNIEVVVLDRPNPHDGYIDGPVLKKKFSSFVGMHEVPVIYGLTIGEYGKMVIGEKWLSTSKTPKYTVVPMRDYHKLQRYAISDKPSPNLPNDHAINLYPSLCFFEGTQISVGRGTASPFEVYGSPWNKSLPYQFTPQPVEGAKSPFLNGQLCYGEDLTEMKVDLRELNLSWLIKAYNTYNNSKQNFFLSNMFFDKLAGTDQLRKQIVNKMSSAEIKKSWALDLERFQDLRKKYVMYPD